ncbi:MAG TPA: serine hydrolase domain-containing protein, partial [Candidatus Berkiella sp.]|nr:serine hydrolase domain-containing protein [Candidatus Berkiella sp.]
PSIKSLVKKANSEKVIQSGLLVIAREGKILFTQSYGFADRENKLIFSIDTLFPLGSISKQFTAALILKLVEMKKIDLNAPIDTYLENVPKEWHQIKVHDLLTHTNGLKECYDLLKYSAPYDRDACFEAVKSLPLAQVPGKKFEYNNTGYFLLAKIIEKVTGKSYPDFIKQTLNKPLHLTHIYSPNLEGDYPSVIFQRDRLAKHYLITPQAEKLEYAKANETNLNFAHYLTGAGELIGNANDLIAWTQDLFESDY